jgi:hypothetical protein
MSVALNLYLDVQSKVLLDNINSTSAASASLLAFIQGDNPTINIFPLLPTGSISIPYTAVDLHASTLQVAVCGGDGLPTGTLGGPTPIAYSTGWTWSIDHFIGTLNFNTQEVADFLGTAAVESSTFEIEESDTSDTRFQFPCTVKAQVIEGNVISLSGLPAYYFQDATPTGSIGQGSLWLAPTTATLSVYDGSTWDTLHP